MDRFVTKKIEKQTIYEIYRACRLCGAGGGYKMPIIQSVVNLDSCDVELKQKIRECVHIEVHQNDKMPPLICELCVDKVNDFYEFLEMCRQTNKRTRLKLGLPPQMLPRGAPDAGDCILGVTEPIFVNDEDSNEPLSDKKNKAKGLKPKKEPEKNWKEVKTRLEDKTPPRESRSSRQRAPSPPRLRRDSRLQTKVKKGFSPPPKSILKKEKKPEPSPQWTQSGRLKRSREPDVKPDQPTKRVKISLTPPPSKSKQSPRLRRQHVTRGGQQEREREGEGDKQARDTHTSCSVCGLMLKTTQAMVSHRRSHVVTYTNPKLACNPCETWFRDTEEAETHHRRHRRHYRCRRCGHSGDTLRAYDEHIERGECVQVEEAPDERCHTCWKTFPTLTSLRTHRCAGRGARPGGKCGKCGKSYATQKSLTNHTKFCKKVPDAVVIPPELRGRLRPLQVRVARCDPLLVNMKRKHYDVSAVETNFGLDKNCVYPFLTSGLRIKSEPSDCMVKINELGFDNYLHWDSPDESGDSDMDNFDSLDHTAFTRTRQVETLVACSLKTIFSSRFLGKVPRKFRRVKIESVIDSALNDSLSDLNINDSAGSFDKNITVSDKVDDSDSRCDGRDDDDLFPKENSVVKVTNDDFDSLFSESKDNDKTDSGGDVTVSGDTSQSLADNNSDSENIKDFGDVENGAKEYLVEKNNDSVNVINKSIDTTESTNENIVEDDVKEKSTDLENVQPQDNQLDVATDNSNQKVPPETNLINDLENAINDGDTKMGETLVVKLNHNDNVNQTITDKDNLEEDKNRSEELFENRDLDTKNYTENNLQNNKVLYNDYDKENRSNVVKLETCTERMEADVTEKTDTLKILQADTEHQNNDNSKNNDESNTEATTDDINEEPKVSDDKSTLNGDADIDDIHLNMNDLEDYSDSELMAELDAQIGDKKREGDGQNDTNEESTESQSVEAKSEAKNEDEDEGISETDKEVKTAELIPTRGMVDVDFDGDSQDKITLEDLLPERRKCMELDSISDDELEFDD